MKNSSENKLVDDLIKECSDFVAVLTNLMFDPSVVISELFNDSQFILNIIEIDGVSMLLLVDRPLVVVYSDSDVGEVFLE